MKCFADTDIGLKGCSALTKKRCANCSFFKTKEQVAAEKSNTITRLKKIGRFAYFNDLYKIGEC